MTLTQNGTVMSLKRRLVSGGEQQAPGSEQSGPDRSVLDQLAGITGIGWTASALGFLSTVVGHGNSVVTRLVAEPQSLLYIGGVFFLATFGLDRLTRHLSEARQ